MSLLRLVVNKKLQNSYSHILKDEDHKHHMDSWFNKAWDHEYQFLKYLYDPGQLLICLP